MEILRAENVSKIYGNGDNEVRALDEVSFSVQKGEFVAIIGPSGSGKSTLMNMIGCLDVPTAGEMYIDGRSVREMTDDELTVHRRDRIGFIFQKFNLIGLLTAYENVEYPMILKYGKRDDTGRPKELLASVGIDEAKMMHTPFELSGGQQQRVAIARALANDPALLLCDEPTGNLDSKMSEQIMALLQDLNRKGRTIVMVTHDPKTATYANRTIVIRDGEIVDE